MTDLPKDLHGNTSNIVASYVANNSVAAADLPALIDSVFKALSNAGKAEVPAAEKPQPAVPIKKSVADDYIICLEDGKKLKMLKRHLKTRYNMTPDEYRQRWGLPSDYPMVAPAYAEQRSVLAVKIGLGRKPEAAPVVESPSQEARPSRRRVAGRRKAAA
jgi:predicted transcriptional regulator